MKTGLSASLIRSSLWVLTTLLMLGYSSCKKDEEPQEGPPFETGAEHIDFFGFTLIDTYWDDPLDSIAKTVYNDEVHSFSNSADILVVSPNDDIVQRMLDMEALQMKSLLHVSEIFFELNGNNAPSGANYDLRIDYQDRWNDFFALNDLNTNQELICALYLGEEPTWNGISSTDLAAASDYIKTTISSLPIMIIEAYPALNDLMVPTAVDWVGWDHYFLANPSSDPSFLNELATIKSKLSTQEQRLVLIMDAHYIPAVHGSIAGLTQADMKNVATEYYDLARSEPQVVAVFGYTWPGGFDDPSMLGARQLPFDVRQEYSRIGKVISGKD